MTDLREQFARLAERGPVVEPQLAVRQVMQRASADIDSADIDSNVAFGDIGSDQIGSTSPGLHLVDGPVTVQAGRSRKVGLAAAAAVVLVSVAGATLARSTFTSPSATKIPAAATIAPSTSTVEPSTSTSTSVVADLHNDPTLLAMMNSLLDVGTPDEMVLSLSTNIPESEVAACMAAAGYPYIEGETPSQEVAHDLRNTMPAADYAATYGFGIAASELGLLPEYFDPNMDYRGSLTPTEREPYVAANSWCSGYTPQRSRASTALNAGLDQIRAELAADPQVVAALANWQACMSAAGYSYDTPQAMLESLYARMSSHLDHEQLQQLLTDEIPIAIVNVPCQAVYKAAYREAADARFAEYRILFEASLEAQGSGTGS
jgi:hypothetical protein